MPQLERTADRVAQHCTTLLLFVGLVWRLSAYLGNPVLYTDEAALARTLMTRPVATLLEPLDFVQVVAPGLLLLQKGILALAGSSEYALRWPALCASFITLIVGTRIARTILAPWPGVAFVLLLALSPVLVTYAVSAKPYSVDLMASLIVLWSEIRTNDDAGTTRRWMVGLTAVLSFSVAFVLLAAAAARLVLAQRRGDSRDLRVASLLASAALVSIALSRLLTSTTDLEYLQWFWTGGFPSSSGVAETAIWIGRALAGLFGQTMQYRGAWAWLALLVVGIAAVGRRSPERAVLLALPIVLVVVASVLRFYPLEAGRTQLFLVPGALLGVASGLAVLGDLKQPALRTMSHVAVGLVMLAGVQTALRSDLPPIVVREDMRPFLAAVRREWQEADHVLVPNRESQVFLYYAPRYGFRASDYTLAACPNGRWPQLSAQIVEASRRSRVWLALPAAESVDGAVIRRHLAWRGGRPSSALSGRSYGLRFEMSGEPPLGDPPAVPDLLVRPAAVPWQCYGVFDPLASSDPERHAER